MPAPPYYNALPLDGNGRRYVDQSAWDSVIGAFYAWPDNVNANTKNLSNLGAVTFAAGGYVAGPATVQRNSATGSDPILILNQGSGAINDAGTIDFRRTGNPRVSLRAHWFDGFTVWTKTAGGDTLLERVRITPDGSVGIGTISPGSVIGWTPTLHIKGTLPALILEGTTAARRYNIAVQAGGGLTIVDETAGADSLIIPPGGIQVYANNAAAVGAGLTAKSLYRTGADPDHLCIVH